MMTDYLTLDGGHTIQNTDLVSQKCTLEAYMTLLTNVTPIHLIRKAIWDDLAMKAC